MTYQGKWTCSECGDTSDNEHDPCACDDTCTEHIETIDSLRLRLKQTEAERDAAVRERDELRGRLATCKEAHAALIRNYSDVMDEKNALVMRLKEQP